MAADLVERLHLLEGDTVHIAPSFHEKKKLFTECFFVDDSASPARQRVLLGVKKRGFKAGLCFGYGGKVEKSDDSILAAATREVQEECGLSDVRLQKVGLVFVKFPDKNFEIHAFRGVLREVAAGSFVTRDASAGAPDSKRPRTDGVNSDSTDAAAAADAGAVKAPAKVVAVPVETEEMRPEWFDQESMPWERTIPDAKLWFPRAWQGKPFLAQFVLDANDEVLWHDVSFVDADALARVDADRESQFGPDCAFLS